MPKTETKTKEVAEPKYIESELYGGKVKVKFYPLSHQYWFSVKGAPFKRKSGPTSYIGIKDKSTALGIWQQTMTLDFLLNMISKGRAIDEDLAIEAVIQNDVAKDESVDIGKDMHDWIERYIKFKLKKKGYDAIPEMPTIPEAITGVMGFLAWEKEMKPKYVSSERIVYSMKYDMGGTLDIELIIDKLLYLGDFKSTNGLYNTVRMQTASYVKSDVEENKSKKYHGRWVFRFSKYTEEEYLRREKRKQVIKRKIAEFKGKEYTDKDIPPYQAFEAKFLDKNKGMLEDDFDAFLHAKALFEWDKRTDWYWNPEY